MHSNRIYLQIGCRETEKLGKGDEDGNPENSFCDGFFGKFPLGFEVRALFREKYAAKLFILHVIQQPSYPLGMYAEISFDAMDKFSRNLSEVTEKEMKELCEQDLRGSRTLKR